MSPIKIRSGSISDEPRLGVPTLNVRRLIRRPVNADRVVMSDSNEATSAACYELSDEATKDKAGLTMMSRLVMLAKSFGEVDFVDTTGRHRAVAVANAVAERLKAAGHEVFVVHDYERRFELLSRIVSEVNASYGRTYDPSDIVIHGIKDEAFISKCRERLNSIMFGADAAAESPEATMLFGFDTGKQ